MNSENIQRKIETINAFLKGGLIVLDALYILVLLCAIYIADLTGFQILVLLSFVMVLSRVRFSYE